ncbi:uncharacterized protein LOC142586544 isoform X2 [Dermacentor variabilis]|uniref:uncharacterized protein LOC142586544 isoform X2 n=1 Tax=Dermacentor variabilis TaxID=34621 RepID=UPI003F5B40DF
MGTCYSSKSKSASQPYSSAPMSASSSQDSALRLPRATPYTRGTVAPIDTSEVNFRRCIPPPTKYRANPSQSGNLQGKANVTVTTDFADRSRRAVTDNADVNNPSFNNNFEDGSSSQDFTNFKKDVVDTGAYNVTDSCSLRVKTEGAKVSSENSEQMRIQYGATKIPTKITAHLSGLPKPQVAVVTTRVPPVPQRATSEKLHATARTSNQPVGEAAAAEKRTGCQHRVSPDKESISDRSHSGDSGSTDYDSGLGHSLSDPPAGSENGGKAQSSSTTLQVESSPVLKEAVGVGKEFDSAVLPTTLPVGAQLTTVDGTASKMGVYDQPDSYAAYRGILSYRRITPIKKYSETPQWKRSVEPKITKGFSSPTRAVIAKGILTKGAKAAKDCSPEQKREGVAKGPSMLSAPLSPPNKEEKSGGFLSPTSDGFLIDDDISDQPGLIALERSRGRGAPSVKKSIFELHALQSFSGRQTKVDRTLDDLHPLCSDAGSSCSSLGSDDLMLDFETPCKDSPEITSSPAIKYAGTQLRRVARPSVASQAEKRNSWDSNHSDEGAALRRASDSLASRWPLKTPSSATAAEARPRTVSLPLRPPRQVVMQECDDGGVKLDSSSYRSVCQDLNGLKTMLLKLRRILQDAETLNPFELPNTKNYFYHALASTDLPHGFTHTPTGDTPDFNPIDPNDVLQENMDLKRQLILMQQQLEDKDHTIHLLQQQMTKYMDITSVEKDPVKVNVAVQTERPKFLQSISSSEEGSSQGRLVSSDIKNALEEHFKSSSICHAAFSNKIEDVSKSLSNITQALRLHSSKPHLPNRSQSSWELLS